MSKYLSDILNKKPVTSEASSPDLSKELDELYGTPSPKETKSNPIIEKIKKEANDAAWSNIFAEEDKQVRINNEAVDVMKKYVAKNKWVPDSVLNLESGKAWVVGQATDRLGFLGHAKMNYALADKPFPKELEKEIADYQKILQYKSPDKGFSYIVNAAAKLLGQQHETITDAKHNPYVTGAVATLTAAAAGAVTGGVGAIPSGSAGAAATTAAIANRSAMVEGGHAYLDFLNLKHGDGRPVTPKQAAFFAKGVGGINGMLEVAGFSAAAKMFPFLKKFTGAWATKNPTVRQALLEGTRRWSTGVAAETSVEMTQELPGIVFSAILEDKDVAAALTSDKTKEQLWEVMKEVGAGMGLLGGVGAAHGTYSSIRNASRAETNEKPEPPPEPETPVPSQTKDLQENVFSTEKQKPQEPLESWEDAPQGPPPAGPKPPKSSAKEQKAEPSIQVLSPAEAMPGAVAERGDGTFTDPTPSPEISPAATKKIELLFEDDTGYPTVELSDGVRKAAPKRVWTISNPSPIRETWLTRPAVMMDDGTIFEGPTVNAPSISTPIIADYDALLASRRKSEQAAVNHGYNLTEMEDGAPSNLKDTGFVISGPAGTQVDGQLVWVPSSMVDQKYKGKHASLQERLQAAMGDRYEKAVKAKETGEQVKQEKKIAELSPEERAVLDQKYHSPSNKKLHGKPMIEILKQRVSKGLQAQMGKVDVSELDSVINDALIDAARSTAKAGKTKPTEIQREFFKHLRGFAIKRYNESFGKSRRQHEKELKEGTKTVSYEKAGLENKPAQEQSTDATAQFEAENTVPTKVSAQTPIKKAQAKAEQEEAGKKKPPIRTKVYTPEEIQKLTGQPVEKTKAAQEKKKSRQQEAIDKRVETLSKPRYTRNTKTLYESVKEHFESLVQSSGVKGPELSERIRSYGEKKGLLLTKKNGDSVYNGLKGIALHSKTNEEVANAIVIPVGDDQFILVKQNVDITDLVVKAIEQPSVKKEPTVLTPEIVEEEKPLPKIAQKEIWTRKEAKAELFPLFDIIDEQRYKKKIKYPVKEINLKPGELADIPHTWHDGVFRYTAMKFPDGHLESGRSGSYDTIMMAGQVAGAKQRTIPPGHTLYILDAGPYPNQISQIIIYRSPPEIKTIGTEKNVKALPAPKVEKTEAAIKKEETNLPQPKSIQIGEGDDAAFKKLLKDETGSSSLIGDLAGKIAKVINKASENGAKLHDLLDIEAKWKRSKMAKIGLSIKNYFSRRDAEERQGLQDASRIRDMFPKWATKDDLVNIVLIAEDASYAQAIPENKRDALVKVATVLRKYFDDSQKEFADRGLILDFKNRQIASLEEKIKETTDEINKQELEAIKEAIENDSTFTGPAALKERKRLHKTEQKLEKIKQAEFVHIPYRLIFNRKLREYLSSTDPIIRKKKYAEMRSLLAVKRHANTLREMLERKNKNGELIIDEETRHQFNPINIIMNYAFNKGQDHALLDIRDALKAENDLMRVSKTKPKVSKDGYDWFKVDTPKFSVLQTALSKEDKKEKRHLWVRVDAIRAISDAMTYTDKQTKWDKIMAVTKMTAFHNPFILPMYDIYQGMVGLTINPAHLIRTIKAFKKAIKDVGGFRSVFTQQYADYSKDYIEALRHGLESKPFSSPFEEWKKVSEELLGGKSKHWTIDFLKSFVHEFKKASPMAKATVALPVLKAAYMASWQTAWALDGFIRMTSYNVLIEKGHTPEEAAQTVAKIHSDYASVPPKTRKTLNKFFFTPTFKITMLKLHYAMTKAAMKTGYNMALHPLSYKDRTSKPDRRLARTFIGMFIVNHMFDMVLMGLGFERDKWNRRYKKRFIDENGLAKEFVVTFATPFNIIQRFTERYDKSFGDPSVINPMARFVQLNKWEFHPLYRHAYAALFNEGDSGKIVTENAPWWQHVAGRGWYFTSKTVAMLDSIQTRTELAAEPEKRKNLLKFWVKEYGEGMGHIYHAINTVFGYAYITDPEDRRMALRLRQNYKEFQKEAYQSIDKKGVVDPAIIKGYQERFKEIAKERAKKK